MEEFKGEINSSTIIITEIAGQQKADKAALKSNWEYFVPWNLWSWSLHAVGEI
jgi:hypothetical protein